jgi:hypothetical protein
MMNHPRLAAALAAAVVILVSCGGGSPGAGDGLEEDVGAQLACEAVRENWEKVAEDPTSHPGEAGEIVGFAESADDPGLRAAAEAFDRDPSSRTWERFRTRCEELGLG